MQVVQGLPGVRRQRGELVLPPSHERHQLQPQQLGAGGGGAGPQTVHPAAVEQERGRAAAGDRHPHPLSARHHRAQRDLEQGEQGGHGGQPQQQQQRVQHGGGPLEQED